ncbi:hypothetical protein [Kibdelosporangium phytohabitans]|uniref:Uncharacterized protein n=1 Tax=Kibdelosporangium phytohabitans TaxID=860235 RepID=A0A0N7F2R6_9PSEU|nr:hypothetical protein [Kibdelosporangium phytohabitans]ALG06575.1 hypothetical protein AOZ06_06220 [Kibdelosporangium phytohabitans]MBE1467766.1 hypothetical protein [Kibdelosporangium phytohabitans]
MSYPQQGGYPQQPYPQQPYPAAPSGGGSPATAIIAAVLALAIAGFEVVLLVNESTWIENLDKLPGEVVMILVGQLLTGLVMLIGSIVTFARKTAGAVLILIGALVGLASVLTEPLMLPGGSKNLGRFYETVFEFGSAEATFRALIVIIAPLALIFAVLPPTFKYLRGNRDDFSQYPGGGGYPQQPGYPVDPNSGGFPQQGYPANPSSGGFPQQGYPQQGGYPQQQQGGGYPQQPGW